MNNAKNLLVIANRDTINTGIFNKLVDLTTYHNLGLIISEAGQTTVAKIAKSNSAAAVLIDANPDHADAMFMAYLLHHNKYPVGVWEDNYDESQNKPPHVDVMSGKILSAANLLLNSLKQPPPG